MEARAAAEFQGRFLCRLCAPPCWPQGPEDATFTAFSGCRRLLLHSLFILALPFQNHFAALCDLVTILRTFGRCCAGFAHLYWMSVVSNTSWRFGMFLCALERMGGGRRRAFIAGLAREWLGVVHPSGLGAGGTDESGRFWVIAAAAGWRWMTRVESLKVVCGWSSCRVSVGGGVW